MNRRSFLNQFLKGFIAANACPQIIAHGLGLFVPKVTEPPLLVYWSPNPLGQSFYFEEYRTYLRGLTGFVPFSHPERKPLNMDDVLCEIRRAKRERPMIPNTDMTDPNNWSQVVLNPNGGIQEVRIGTEEVIRL